MFNREDLKEKLTTFEDNFSNLFPQQIPCFSTCLDTTAKSSLLFFSEDRLVGTCFGRLREEQTL